MERCGRSLAGSVITQGQDPSVELAPGCVRRVHTSGRRRGFCLSTVNTPPGLDRSGCRVQTSQTSIRLNGWTGGRTVDPAVA